MSVRPFQSPAIDGICRGFLDACHCFIENDFCLANTCSLISRYSMCRELCPLQIQKLVHRSNTDGRSYLSYPAWWFGFLFIAVCVLLCPPFSPASPSQALRCRTSIDALPALPRIGGTPAPRMKNRIFSLLPPLTASPLTGG